MKSRLLRTLFEGIKDSELIALRAISGSDVKALYTTNFSKAEQFISRHKDDRDVYFGVCTRNEPKPEMEAVQRAFAVWADLDPYHTSIDKRDAISKTLKQCILPPSIILDSGGGYHLYWLIEPTEDLETVQRACKSIEKVVVGAGNVSDATRILRVDNSFNHKEEFPRPVSMLLCKPNKHELTDVLSIVKVSKKVARRIVSGSKRGFKTRSERDWSVILELVSIGFSNEAISRIFGVHKIGDKFAEKGGIKYLEHSIKKAREQVGVEPQNVADADSSFAGIFIEDDCYWVLSPSGKVQLSTFIFQPEMLLHGSSELEVDTLVGTICASGYSWPNIPITRNAFVRADSLIRELPLAAWQWIGSDKYVKNLLPYLMDQLRAQGLPKRVATSQLGFFKDHWVGTTQAISSVSLFEQGECPVATLPTKGERPDVSYRRIEKPAKLKKTANEFFNTYAKTNTEDIVWPVLGWAIACMYKEKLDKVNVRFPTLNLFGTRGSGKTSIITQIIQPLFGYDENRLYDCTTTQFVMLSLFGSTNGIPVAFGEYRASLKASANRILRYLLLSYDTGHDPRGRADQSVVDYPLDAPFSIDGEDAIADSAALERIIQINMHPETIEEGSEAYESFHHLIQMDLKGLGTEIIRFSIDKEPEWDKAYNLVQQTFTVSLPDRVRRNMAVAVVGLLGAESFATSIGAAFPKVSVGFLRDAFGIALENIINTAAGRSLILVDEFVEDIINSVAMTFPEFAHKYDAEENVLWFHLSSAMSWWRARRKQQDRPILDTTAIKAQLKERHSPAGDTSKGRYVVDKTAKTIDRKTYWCYGVSLSVANDIGLDVPMTLDIPIFREAKKGRKNERSA